MEDTKLIIECFKKDSKVKFEYPQPEKGQYIDCRKRDIKIQRSEIKEFSEKSVKRLKIKLRNLSDDMKYILCLTYPGNYSSDGEVIKEHLNYFLTYVRRKWSNLKYFWVLEFQKRGAPHFHMIFNEPGLLMFQGWLKRIWYKIVASGDKKHLEHGVRRVEVIRKSVVSYLCHYFKKDIQKKVPENYSNVGRFWGHTRKLIEYSKIIISTYYRENLFFVIKDVIAEYKNLCKSWGFDWEFKDQGFLFYDSAGKIYDLITAPFNALSCVLGNDLKFELVKG